MARKFYEMEEAAQLLGITAEQLNEMRDRREVYAVRDGGTWKFKVEEIELPGRGPGRGNAPRRRGRIRRIGRRS